MPTILCPRIDVAYKLLFYVHIYLRTARACMQVRCTHTLIVNRDAPLLNGTAGPCSWPIDSNRIVEQMAATRCDVSRHCLSAERCTVVVSGGERLWFADRIVTQRDAVRSQPSAFVSPANKCQLSTHQITLLLSQGVFSEIFTGEESGQPFARYGKGVCTCARADAPHLWLVQK